MGIRFEDNSFSLRYKQVDNDLLDRRNKVAHGKYLNLDPKDFRKLVDDVLRQFKTSRERGYLQSLQAKAQRLMSSILAHIQTSSCAYVRSKSASVRHARAALYKASVDETASRASDICLGQRSALAVSYFSRIPNLTLLTFE